MVVVGIRIIQSNLGRSHLNRAVSRDTPSRVLLIYATVVYISLCGGWRQVGNTVLWIPLWDQSNVVQETVCVGATGLSFFFSFNVESTNLDTGQRSPTATVTEAKYHGRGEILRHFLRDCLVLATGKLRALAILWTE